MELYPLRELTKYNYVKSEVRNAYLQILDIYVPDHVLERGIYFLRKNGINVNFVSLSYVTYLILKYKVGISYKEFKYMMNQKRIKYKRLLRETKRKIFKPIA
jgi:predicted nucleotidyltransferase